ncbi:MAG: hypothetical protein OFPII_41680 [Osedax symbiont Rs1]|nr:MAG: hypothetical protein OFPII_41680 [Osedax symbiont Rs1]
MYIVLRMFVVSLILLSFNLKAAPNIVDAPAELQKWHGWILHQYPELNCSSSGGSQHQQCLWKSPINIQVTSQAIDFSLEVVAEKPEWLALPGDSEAWPKSVLVNGQAAKVMQRNRRPAIFLGTGEFKIKGTIALAAIPLSLTLPKSTTFINLSIEGQKISQPSVSGQSLLLSQAKAKRLKKSDSLTIQVYRLIRDGYPLWLNTQLEINVSGDKRVTTIGRVLPEGFELTNIQSKLPLRINSQGQMQIQLRPGRHIVSLQARLIGEQESFSMQANNHWPAQELWSFAPSRSYRIVDVKGAPIDSSQTNIPKSWQQYASYLVSAEHGLQIIERSRGDVNPDQHQLELRRNLWLSFSGNKFTSQERLTGTMGYLDRLSAEQGYLAGRVTINQQPVLITSVDSDQGVEVLAGSIQLSSVGQVTGNSIAVNPWSNTIKKAELTVNLPPGYSMFAVEGADSVSNDYLSSWNLWQIFVAILFIVVLFKQYGVSAAIVGLLYTVVVHNVEGAPSIVALLIIIGFHFLTQVLPAHKVRTFAVYGYQLTLILIVLNFLPFVVQQARLAIYPQLERPYSIHQNPSYQQQADDLEYREVDEVHSIESSAMAPAAVYGKSSSLMKSKIADKLSQKRVVKKYQRQYQEHEVIQIGPGMPSWQWNSVNIRLSGPVVSGQSIEMMIIPPWLNRIINLLRIVLFFGLAYLFLRGQSFKLGGGPRGSVANNDQEGQEVRANAEQSVSAKVTGGLTGLLVMTVFSAALFNSEPLMAADYPSPALLDEYYQRLSESAPCQPDCIAINQLTIQGNAASLTMKLQVAALTKTALRLPFELGKINNVEVLVDAQPAKALARVQGYAYLLLDEGFHEINLVIDSKDLSQLNLQFQPTPQFTEFSGDAWQISGLDKHAINNGRLMLRKIKRQKLSETEKQLTPNPIAPLVKVTRRINLGLDWSVTTTVTRIAPSVGAINVSIDLLSGESVTSADLKIKQRQAIVDFSRNARSITWHSDLEKKPELSLTAVKTATYFEVWEIVPSLKWHLSYQGIKPIKSNTAKLTWMPTSGDKLTLNIQRPVPVQGASLSTDEVQLTYTPGNRQSVSNLRLKFRASKGADYPLQLPAGAKINSILLNNKSIIYVEELGKVILPIPPGANSIDVNWSMDESLSWLTHTPQLALPDATNIALNIKMPDNRWILAVQGPLIGPAILFWGVLMMILLICFVLGRQAWSPLKSWQWMLMGAGIATSFWPVTLLVVAWFVVLAKHHKLINADTSTARFQIVQIGIGVLTAVMLLALIGSVANSLMFGAPDMQVIGNGSYANDLHWYQDAISAQLPSTTVISVPMWGYQILMLLWSIWLSMSLLRWLKWGWSNYTAQGLWKQTEVQVKPATVTDKSTDPAKPKAKRAKRDAKSDW